MSSPRTSTQTNIYSSGSNHEYGRVAHDQGLDFMFPVPDTTRYIRLWVGKSSLDNQVPVFEIQPLVEEASDPVANVITSAVKVPVNTASSHGDVSALVSC